MAGRPQGKSGVEQRGNHTALIETTKIIKRLNRQALGEEKMGAQDVQAAQILLRKVLPDLKVSEIEHSGDVTLRWQKP